MEPWYFAYGSNLSLDQMVARTGSIGDAKYPPRVATLANHRVVFQRLEKGEPAYANILTPGDGVLGVVYRCSQADLEKLDYHEWGYDRQPITVTDQHGEVLAAVVYIMRPERGEIFGKPSEDYLEEIVSGAKHHGLPEHYIAKIVATARSGMNPPEGS